MTKRTEPRSRLQIAFTWNLLLISLPAIGTTDSFAGWLIVASLGFFSLLALVLRVGWVVPCTIAGAYVGVAGTMDQHGYGSTVEDHIRSVTILLMTCTIVGLVMGLFIDGSNRPGQNESEAGGT